MDEAEAVCAKIEGRRHCHAIRSRRRFGFAHGDRDIAGTGIIGHCAKD